MLVSKHKAIIGLGNPEARFALSPHNAGHKVVDALAEAAGRVFVSGVLYSAMVAELTVGDIRLTLVKPTVGMNDSGLAFAEAMSKFSLDFPELLVVFDDLSLPLGTIRFRDAGRSAAGHRGLASILEQVPEDRLLSRLKIGIGPDPGGANRFAYVTAPLPEPKRPLFRATIVKAQEAALHWARLGLASAMNGYNCTG